MNEKAYLAAKNPQVEEIVEVYGECSAYVSQNDIDGLQEELAPAEFAEVSARLGWGNNLDSLEARVEGMLEAGDREGAEKL